MAVWKELPAAAGLLSLSRRSRRGIVRTASAWGMWYNVGVKKNFLRLAGKAQMREASRAVLLQPARAPGSFAGARSEGEKDS